MPVQTPQWSEFLSCPVCQNEFETRGRVPVSLTCGHTICKTCLQSLQRNQCPFDQNPIGLELNKLPANTALLQLIGNGEVPKEYRSIPEVPSKDKPQYSSSIKFLEDLALFLKPSQSSQLSRPMQRKLITLVTSQLLHDEGRARGVRAARSLGERSVTELILQHQNPQQLSANLWAAVRARGCQFLGPAMQEEVLKLVLLALEEGSALSRKVLVMFVVQRLEPHFPQASKTSIGHVVQLLYRASCFKVTKREGDSSLMQLKEEFRTYDNLRREHDTQIVQIATEGGLRIAPDQWSSLLYGDSAHKSHMQSIIDKLQTPQSFGQSVQELVIALQRTGDPGRLSCLRPHLDILTNIDPSGESEVPSWDSVVDALKAAHTVVGGLVSFCNLTGAKKTGETYNGHLTRYKTSMCRDLAHHGSCPRGQNCTFAHTQSELDFHRNGVKNRTQGGEESRSSSTVREAPSNLPLQASMQRQRAQATDSEGFSTVVSRQGPPPPIQGQMMQRQQEGQMMQRQQEGQRMQRQQEGEMMQRQQEGQMMQRQQEGQMMQRQQEGQMMQRQQDGQMMQRQQEGQRMQRQQEGQMMQRQQAPLPSLSSRPAQPTGNTKDLAHIAPSAEPNIHQLSSYCSIQSSSLSTVYSDLSKKEMTTKDSTSSVGSVGSRPLSSSVSQQMQVPMLQHPGKPVGQPGQPGQTGQLGQPVQLQAAAGFMQEMPQLQALSVPPVGQQQLPALPQLQQGQNNQILVMPTIQAQPQITPIVDALGAPVIDMNTGQPLVAAHPPIIQPPVQLADGSIIPAGVQQNPVQIANIQMAQSNNIGMTTIIMPPTPQPIIPLSQEIPIRRFSHDISPDLATKSLSALKDRKEEIISELGDIVGPTAAKVIGDITFKQAANQKFPVNAEIPTSRQSPVDSNAGFYGIWTSRPIATIPSLKHKTTKEIQNNYSPITTSTTKEVSSKHAADISGFDEFLPLPEGICVSRFGPISRKNFRPETQVTSDAWSVTARNTNETKPTPSMLQPLATACAMPDNVMQVHDQNVLFQYNPGYYGELPMEGMDSVSMQHLVNPPRLPVSPMPNPREQQCKISTQNYSMFVETNRIHKELQELQRRISCLSVAENSAHMALKRDRLAFELRMVEGGIQDRHKEMINEDEDDKSPTLVPRNSPW